MKLLLTTLLLIISTVIYGQTLTINELGNLVSLTPEKAASLLVKKGFIKTKSDNSFDPDITAQYVKEQTDEDVVFRSDIISGTVVTYQLSDFSQFINMKGQVTKLYRFIGENETTNINQESYENNTFKVILGKHKKYHSYSILIRTKF